MPTSEHGAHQPAAPMITGPAPGVWRVPEACSPWPPTPAVVDVRDATLTRHQRLQQKINERRMIRLRGAVHDGAGWVVPQSQRVAGRNDRNLPGDPPRIAPAPGAELLPGTWYYLGHWMWQFGHFLIETLPQLWAYRGEPIVAHRFGDYDVPKPWQFRLMELAGVTTAPRVVDEVPVRVEMLRVPTRPAVVGASVSQPAVDIWQRVSKAGAGVPDLPVGQGRMVALSRALLEASRPPGGVKGARAVSNAAALDEVWRRHGFDVVYPELLDIDEQMRVLRGARVLMGVDGSALHASAFARPGTPVILVGSKKRPGGNLSQRAIDAALGNPLAVLEWQGVSAEGQDIDLEDHERRLDAALAELPGA